jgi:hypothetical protein
MHLAAASDHMPLDVNDHLDHVGKSILGEYLKIRTRNRRLDNPDGHKASWKKVVTGCAYFFISAFR